MTGFRVERNRGCTVTSNHQFFLLAVFFSPPLHGLPPLWTE